MRRIIFSVFFVIIRFKLFSQATDAQIRHGFKDSHSETAQILDVPEISFLYQSNKLKKGSYYIVRPCKSFFAQNGNTLTLYSPDAKSSIWVEVNELYRWLNSDIQMAALITISEYTGNSYRDLKLIELQRFN
jgi:hypothetical protein